MYAILCNENGDRELGSDSVIKIDGRLGFENRMNVVRDYRNSFKKHLPTKFDRWTHCFFIRSIDDLDLIKTTICKL